MKLFYPAIFHEEDGSFWVEFPDLEGCHSYGDSLEEVFINAQEALEGYCLTLLESEQTLPKASEITEVQTEDGFVNFIVCELEDDVKKAVRKNCTLPYWLNVLCERQGNINYSQVLQEALIKKLGIQK